MLLEGTVGFNRELLPLTADVPGRGIPWIASPVDVTGFAQTQTPTYPRYTGPQGAPRRSQSISLSGHKLIDQIDESARSILGAAVHHRNIL